MQRRGQARAFKSCVTLLTIQEVNARALLKHQAVETADLLKKGNRLFVAAHEKMLAIVYDIACLLIDERVGASAEMPASFEQRHHCAALCERHACCKSRESAADDEDGCCRHGFLSLLLNQIDRAICKRRFFETVSRLRKTSNCTVGICSSISR